MDYPNRWTVIIATIIMAAKIIAGGNEVIFKIADWKRLIEITEMLQGFRNWSVSDKEPI